MTKLLADSLHTQAKEALRYSASIHCRTEETRQETARMRKHLTNWLKDDSLVHPCVVAKAIDWLMSIQ